jgi:hypothetical protein
MDFEKFKTVNPVGFLIGFFIVAFIFYYIFYYKPAATKEGYEVIANPGTGGWNTSGRSVASDLTNALMGR